MGEVGKRVVQAEAYQKVSGKAVYTHDVVLPDMLHGSILRSPHCHARIISIDTSQALKLPGVVAVITGADFSGRRYQHLGGTYSDRHPLATDKVRFWGEEVAAVAATSLAIAEQACRLIDVEYDTLPASLTPDASRRPDAPDIHIAPAAAAGKNLAIGFSCDYGDIEAAFAAADDIIEDEFEHGIAVPCCMETNGTVASYNPETNTLDIWTATQAPYFIRKEIAHLLDFETERVRIRAVEVGGGFGGKSKMCEQEALAALLSLKAGRPVKITLNRKDEFISGKTDHAKKIRIKTAFSKDGTIQHRSVSLQIDNGAYTAYAPTYVGASRQRTTCLYRIRSAHYDCDLVYTNKVPGGQYRGMGAPHTIWAIESHMDQIAERLGRDPLEYRLSQANQSGDITPLKWRISTCGMSDCLTAVGRMSEWQTKRGERTAERGIGVAGMIHPSGGVIYLEGNYSNTRIELSADGDLIVHTQTADAGTWQNTTLAQVAADALGVRTEQVRVSHMDTTNAPDDLGSAASRVTFVTGNATIRAAMLLKEKIQAHLARHWNCEAERIVIGNGEARHPHDPDRHLSFRKIAELCGPLVADGYFTTPGERPDPVTGEGNYAATYVFGAQTAEVEVERATGRIRILKMCVAQDVGRALNPTAVEGQIYGGVLQGIGMALQEELVFEEGRPVNASFLDYRVPRIGEAPPIDISLIETSDPLGPYGAKAGAEPTINATIAAIANAVAHATGIRFRKLPLTPARVLAALEERDKRRLSNKPWKRPYNAEVAAVRAIYPNVVFPALRKIGTRFAHTPERHKSPTTIRPRSLSDLYEVLVNEPRRKRIIAGGTDMLVGLKQGIYDPDVLVDITGLSEFRGITIANEPATAGSMLVIGAATSLSEIARNPDVHEHFPSLVHCIEQIATPQIRNVATIAGDLCQEKRCWFFRSALPCYKLGGPTCPCFAVTGDSRHHSILGAKRCAAPCPSDLAPMLSALSGYARVTGKRGPWTVAINDLYLWSGLTKVARDEVISHIVIPIRAGLLQRFEKFAIRQGDFAEASVALTAEMHRGTVRHLRLYAGAISPQPLHGKAAEQLLVGQRPTPSIIRAASETLIAGSLPLRNNGHKTHLLVNLAEKALTSAFR
ncbi:MAG: molybdopterin cofactor-binding domain-containing protein [Xanthobacteraceae bacterium]